MTQQPKITDYPDLVEAVKHSHNAQSNFVSMNYDDPSNFLDEQHKAQVRQSLDDAMVAATREVERLCKLYGISYGDAMNARLS